MALPSCLCVAGRPPFDRLGDIYCALSHVDLACVTPEVVSAEINGTVLTITFSHKVTGHSGFSLTINGVDADLTFLAGEGTSTYAFSTNPAAAEGDPVVLQYSPGDVADRDCPLEAFLNFEVTNNTGVFFYYLRPDGVSRYLRPDGVSFYLRP